MYVYMKNTHTCTLPKWKEKYIHKHFYTNLTMASFMSTKSECEPAGKWVSWGTCVVGDTYKVKLWHRGTPQTIQKKEAKCASVYTEPQPGKMSPWGERKTDGCLEMVRPNYRGERRYGISADRVASNSARKTSISTAGLTSLHFIRAF